jgi:hypothetical protein
MKTLRKGCLLTASAAMFALTLGLSGCGDDSADLADLTPPNHDFTVPSPVEDLAKPNLDAGQTD